MPTSVKLGHQHYILYQNRGQPCCVAQISAWSGEFMLRVANAIHTLGGYPREGT